MDTIFASCNGSIVGSLLFPHQRKKKKESWFYSVSTNLRHNSVVYVLWVSCHPSAKCEGDGNLTAEKPSLH